LAQTLVYKPIDLRNPSLFKRGSGEDAIAQTIADGTLGGDASAPQLHHTHHELAMPAYAHLTETERRSIALYVISLRAGGFNRD
jgi:hypothetical protein